MAAPSPVGVIGLGLMGTALAARLIDAQTLKDAEPILDEARRSKQHLPITLVQAGLLRAAITLAGPDADSAAIIEAIRPSRAPSGAST